MVLPKVSPWKGVIRSRKWGKLGPIYNGPFRIIAQVGKVTYRLDLPEELRQIHITFHVSRLWKCLVDDSMVIPLEGIQVDDRMNYIEKPVANFDREMKDLRNKRA